jgi:PTH1 family peptidyl-tRNA hydrolase
MLIIAGLGNPGGKYAGNRHNIGFMAVDAIHRRHSFSPWSKKFRAEIAEGEIGGEKVLLIKPQTFMNLSGESVGEAMRFYKLQPADLVAIYDELDLAPGKARLKTGGGHGGHNGIRSLDAHCGREYRRLRLGIGHPGVKEMVQNHVLGDFAKAEEEKPGKENKNTEKKPAGQSHIPQARNHNPPKLPASGPMADMLKKMFGNKGE